MIQMEKSAEPSPPPYTAVNDAAEMDRPPAYPGITTCANQSEPRPFFLSSTSAQPLMQGGASPSPQGHTPQDPTGPLRQQPVSARSIVVIYQPPNAEPYRNTGTLFCAVFTCICCFCPTGLVAVYYAIQAAIAAKRRDIGRAKVLNKKAGNWIGTTVTVFIIMVMVIGGVMRLIVKSQRFR